MSTICPKCEKVVRGVAIKEVMGSEMGGRVWQCFSLNCARCGTSLGVQIDPMAIKATLMEEIRAGI